jgi:hypothetical protein
MVVEPASLPFSQSSGLPKPFRAVPEEAVKRSVAVAELPKPSVAVQQLKPQIVAVKVEPPTPAKSRKVHKRKPAQLVQQPATEGRYAGYPRDFGSTW